MSIVVRNDADFDMRGFVLKVSLTGNGAGGPASDGFYVLCETRESGPDGKRLEGFSPLVKVPLERGVPHGSSVSVRVPLPGGGGKSRAGWQVEIVDLLY